MPLENSGREVSSLDYKGEENEKLSDANVQRLAEALLTNDKFAGSLDLSGNNLTDLAALALSKSIERPGARNITKLNLSNNSFTSVAGIYIGTALLRNPDYTLAKLQFENVNLSEQGLVRVLEACNTNKHIEKLHVGTVTDGGLEILAAKLKDNTSLEEIIFQEISDH